MKKLTLVTASLLSLGVIGTTPCSVNADIISPTQAVSGQTHTPLSSLGITVLDRGEFDNPINIDQYDYTLNEMGFNTGKVTMQYNSTSLVTVGIGEAKHFNLKLPTEFNRISGMNDGVNLKSAITASYKLPGASNYTDFKPNEITTSYEGQIDFKLSETSLISIGQITKIKISINYGKILDGLALGPTFDYHSIIPNSASGTYQFKGILTNDDWINIWPDNSVIGNTDGNSAVK